MAFHTNKSSRHERSDRRIFARLALHAELMKKYEAEGLPRDQASKKAFAEVLEKKIK